MSYFTRGLPHPDSPGEQALHRLHLRGRLPGFEFNREVGPYLVDLVNRDAQIVVEVDGFAFHDADPDRAQRDRARDRQLTLQGFRVLRFTSSEVVADPESTALEIEGAAAAPPWAVVETVTREVTEPELRGRIHELTQVIVEFLDVHEGLGTGAQWARRMNALLKSWLGPADERTASQQRKAFEFLGFVHAHYLQYYLRADAAVTDAELVALLADRRARLTMIKEASQ